MTEKMGKWEAVEIIEDCLDYCKHTIEYAEGKQALTVLSQPDNLVAELENNLAEKTSEYKYECHRADKLLVELKELKAKIREIANDGNTLDTMRDRILELVGDEKERKTE